MKESVRGFVASQVVCGVGTAVHLEVVEEVAIMGWKAWLHVSKDINAKFLAGESSRRANLSSGTPDFGEQSRPRQYRCR